MAGTGGHQRGRTVRRYASALRSVGLGNAHGSFPFLLHCPLNFLDDIRAIDDPKSQHWHNTSSGVHLVFPPNYWHASFVRILATLSTGQLTPSSWRAPPHSQHSPPDMGLIQFIDDERVIFVLPWQNRVVVGTTDRAMAPSERPAPSQDEVHEIVHELSAVLEPNTVRPRPSPSVPNTSAIIPAHHALPPSPLSTTGRPDR